MEDTLGELAEGEIVDLNNVLILVLMEDTLGDLIYFKRMLQVVKKS